MDSLNELQASTLFKEHAFIGGRWVDYADDDRITVDNPADGQPVARVPNLPADYIAGGIDAACQAFERWQRQPAVSRADRLLGWYERMLEQREKLARLMTLEQGKPLAEARAEVEYAASFLRWFAEEARRARGTTIPSEEAEFVTGSVKEPVGVVALVTPWNFPLAMITRKAAAALAAGCTVLVRPAKETPLSALALAELGSQAGLDEGEFNVLTTQGERFVECMAADARVRALSFTGSTPVGRKLIEQSAGTIKNVSMELGGNAPFIVCRDADLSQAVDSAIAAKFQTTGQDCIAANRFYVHQDLYESFIEQFSEKMNALPVGNGLDEQTRIGPLIHEGAVEKAKRLVTDAWEKGADISGRDQIEAPGERFFMPTLIAGMNEGMAVAQEESFAPIAPVAPFSRDDEALAAANNTELGLAAYVCGRDEGRVRRYLRELEFGMVGVNTMDITGPHVPFGGMKQAGLGREGAHCGMEEFLETKYFCLGPGENGRGPV